MKDKPSKSPRLTKEKRVEIYLLGIHDFSLYNTYRCPEHGPYSKKKDIDDGRCLYCKKECPLVPDQEIIDAKKALSLLK